MENTGRKSYRNILKSTAVFGGVQVSTTLISIVRGKLVAVVLGSAGMGLYYLLSNAAACIQQIASLGIPLAAVRDVSQANESGNAAVLLRTARILRTMVGVTALLGLVGTALFSPLVARLTVGDAGYEGYFLLLAAAVFFSLLGSGESALLQGMRRYKSLAAISVVLPLCGLLVGVPLYWLWGTEGIVPAMVLQGAVHYVAGRWLADRNGLRGRGTQPRVSLRQTWLVGRGMILLGVVMMLATLLGSLSAYALSAFICAVGSMSDVGFYQSAAAITQQCSGLVFSAMGTDFYPRLSAVVCRDRAAAYRLVNEQTEIVLLVIVPVSMIIISFVPFIIALLLTPEFRVIRQVVRFMGLAVILKAFCFPMDYIALARGDKRFFFWAEGVFSNAKMLLIFMLFYSFKGLNGLGYAALCNAATDVPVSLLLTRLRYGYRPFAATWRLLARLLLMASACFAASFVESPAVSYPLMGIITLSACLYAYRQIDRRVGVRALIASRLPRRRTADAP